MIYRRRATPLHAAGAAAGCAYCLALATAALLASNPLILAAVTVAVLCAGVAAGAGRSLLRAGALAVPVALAIAVVNALVDRNGLTVILRLGDLPAVGQVDITLEATVYGLVLGLRAMALILCGALYTAAIDPDEVLRLFRRVSFRSALSATLATRLVPVLMRDGRRLADAQRCRPGPPPSRLTLMRAACGGVLDRALDVAAALEVRGYATARRGPARRRPLTRHDLSFAAAAAALVALVAGARAAGLAGFTAYPTLHMTTGAGTAAVTAGVLMASLLPFAERRGIR